MTFRATTKQARSESNYNLSDVQQQANVHLSLRHRVIHEIKWVQIKVPEGWSTMDNGKQIKRSLKALQGAVGTTRTLRASGRGGADDDEGSEKKKQNYVAALAGQLRRTCAMIRCEPGFEHECETLTLLASLLWQ